MADEPRDNRKETGDGGLEPVAPAGSFPGESITRRRFFEVGVQAVGGVAGLAVVLPVVGFAAAPMFDSPDEVWQGVGPADEFPSDTYRSAVVTIEPGIGEVGKTTVYLRRGNVELDESPDEYVAISTRCAHLGCPVRFVEAASNFICPCHGGVYGFQGEVIGGPPVRPLDRFQTRVVDGQLEVGPRYSVTSRMEAVRARDPGAFTGGIWEYLYPPRPSTPPAP